MIYNTQLFFSGRDLFFIFELGPDVSTSLVVASNPCYAWFAAPRAVHLAIGPLFLRQKERKPWPTLKLNYRQEPNVSTPGAGIIAVPKEDIPMSDGLSFSARDLLTRLVREDGAIRCEITSLTEPLWFHRGACPEIAVQIADVRELLQNGFIEFWKDSIQPGEELYRASAAGLERAGRKAVADAARSATHYDCQKQSPGQKRRIHAS